MEVILIFNQHYQRVKTTHLDQYLGGQELSWRGVVRLRSLTYDLDCFKKPHNA